MLGSDGKPKGRGVECLSLASTQLWKGNHAWMGPRSAECRVTLDRPTDAGASSTGGRTPVVTAAHQEAWQEAGLMPKYSNMQRGCFNPWAKGLP